MSAVAADLHPVVVEVTARQFRTLKFIYAAMAGLVGVMLAVTLIWAAPIPPAGSDAFVWLILLLAGLGGLLLGLALPLSRRKLMSTAKLHAASREELVAAGLPENVDLRIGRQALYLTRYTAGCVVSWGLCAAVALYGLVARMMGAGPLVFGAFFAVTVFLLLILPPDRARLERRLQSF